MSTVNYPNPNVDLTVRVFDSFYDFEFNVPANEYDVVYSFFKSKFSTDEAARNFTTTLFRISVNNNIPVIDLLDQMRSMNQIDLTVTMAYYLNGQRSPTTLLGVSQVLLPNYYAARNVVQ
jgi:hypothetical protein